MPARLRDISGEKNERLTAIRYIPSKKKWLCQCDCGNESYVSGSNFWRTKSCGCGITAMLIARNFKHGDSFRGKVAPEYGAWAGAIGRCSNPNDDSYEYYGARGIRVCDRWRSGENGKSGYQLFLEDMGRKPSRKHSLDRINNDGNYEPGNCRWATVETQMQNRRNRRMVIFRGKKFNVSVAARLAGLDKDLVLQRLDRGWSDEYALTTPPLPKFGGIGFERFQHSEAAQSLMKKAQK